MITKIYKYILGISVICGMASILLFNKVPVIPSYMPPFEGVFSFFWNPVISCVSTLVMANLFRFVFPNRAEVTAKEKA